MPKVQYFDVSTDALRPNPYNPNRVSPENEEKIRHSIERNGIFKPIIVREIKDSEGCVEYYEIVGGQHRWEQAKLLGYSEVPVANLGEISDKTAKEIGVVDNARYGTDDTLALSEILQEIGDADEILSFLPYGDTDLTTIFSATSIDLSALDIPEQEEDALDAPEVTEKTKPTKTQTIMRFKLGLLDAEKVTALIAKTQKEQGLTTADELTNAGDALVYLLTSLNLMKSETSSQQPEDWDDMLDEIEKAQKEVEDE